MTRRTKQPPVSYEEAKQRVLDATAPHDEIPLSAIAALIWPGNTMSAQGAALAAGRYARQMQKEGLLGCGASGRWRVRSAARPVIESAIPKQPALDPTLIERAERAIEDFGPDFEFGISRLQRELRIGYSLTSQVVQHLVDAGALDEHGWHYRRRVSPP